MTSLPESDVQLAEVRGRTWTGAPAPVVIPGDLPFQALPSRMFERLVAEYAVDVDGIRETHLYGVSGQKQGGLDIVGYTENGDIVVYQARNTESVTATQLRTAVTDFAERPRLAAGPEPRRRFDAVAFTYATRADGSDTKVQDELKALKKAYKDDLKIELLDGSRLNRVLREQRSIVRGVFGQQVADAYCLAAPSGLEAQAWRDSAAQQVTSTYKNLLLLTHAAASQGGVWHSRADFERKSAGMAEGDVPNMPESVRVALVALVDLDVAVRGGSGRQELESAVKKYRDSMRRVIDEYDRYFDTARTTHRQGLDNLGNAAIGKEALARLAAKELHMSDIRDWAQELLDDAAAIARAWLPSTLSRS